MATKFRLKEKAVAVEKAFKESLEIAGNDAVAHFKKSFDNQGFTDESLTTWKPRKGQIRGLGANVRGGLPNTKKTLTKTGALKKSIRVVSTNGLKVRIESALAYSAIHNEGLRGNAWGRHPFKMPKREFMGNSRLLERRSFAKMKAKVKTAILNA
jgi:phage gpG-like protein